MNLSGKRIVLGVTGSIAAYKAVYLLRLLMKEGADVQLVMTPAACEFIGPVTFAALSGKPVLSAFFKKEGGDWNSHVEMGVSADLMLVAPLTASTLGKMANGVADNLLVTTYLSARCPVVLAPAMDLDMYAHPSTQRNLDVLRGYGNHVIEPQKGELASGLEGKGRMEEPERILDFLKSLEEGDSKKKALTGRVLVTAGPTHESIDPVRYIGNHSSGKMGYAIANAFARRGADVVLISGPVGPLDRDDRIALVQVQSAAEMFAACEARIEEVDLAVFCAAVADFTPTVTSGSKLKRGKEDLTIRLRPTRDIAAEMGARKKDGQFFVGFALETDHERANARGKLARKNLDLIVLNSLNDEGAGFGGDTNQVSLISPGGEEDKLPVMPKTVLGDILAERIIKMTQDA
ncbi:MAG: bifunctional phosphopantothenoylcysteine decarboxylase/phosphopantothenate--cysteine ligase CoaBC [Bacteroidetes bacterium]|nr:MAG: bifunctional phosphopantothenoylcysteine decarboxylase/phosphopantothenate--cysteine ligase CoaBC [Bacteroidota bacterium]